MTSIHPDEAAAAQAAADLLASLIAEAQRARGVAHAALAGGNTPRRTYELLGPLLRDPPNVEWWFGDERCVPADDPESNYQLITETLLCTPTISADRVHRIRGELPPAEAAERYAAELVATVPLDDAGIPVLDVALLGLGEDGHTASLFPGDPAVGILDLLAVPVVAVKPPPNRITLTLPVLRAARAIVILATGPGKRDAVERVLAGPNPATPASLLRADSLTLVLDAAAAPTD
ncbi:MAG: 6-phosphogluconolactonase [Gaiellaceae bacterium]